MTPWVSKIFGTKIPVIWCLLVSAYYAKSRTPTYVAIGLSKVNNYHERKQNKKGKPRNLMAATVSADLGKKLLVIQLC